MPLTKGHVLVVTRDHYEKLGDLNVETGREVGQWLPILSRVVMRTIFGDVADSDAHWNVVQNNGIKFYATFVHMHVAAQQVPHLHFHIIPRPPLEAGSSGTRPSFTMFGRGQRDELDDDEGEILANALREQLAREVKRVNDEEGLDLEDSALSVRRGALGKL
ncbi:HIT domain protein [Aspergillus sclerotialis]|uniref:HIT domain protein n=1 Tax=Aspergillus sclerotialis TaxID=2070753 RepID=A0A3A2ZXZ4_9EURO|nr:HIT domain protein [Aspergillus sclerotialis]